MQCSESFGAIARAMVSGKVPMSAQVVIQEPVSTLFNHPDAEVLNRFGSSIAQFNECG